MAGMVGMNVEEIRSISSRLKQQAGEINRLIATIEGLVQRSQSNWQGPDATQFEQAWSGTYKRSLVELERAIEELSQKAASNANHQEQVSQSL